MDYQARAFGVRLFETRVWSLKRGLYVSLSFFIDTV